MVYFKNITQNRNEKQKPREVFPDGKVLSTTIPEHFPEYLRYLDLVEVSERPKCKYGLKFSDDNKSDFILTSKGKWVCFLSLEKAIKIQTILLESYSISTIIAYGFDSHNVGSKVEYDKIVKYNSKKKS